METKKNVWDLFSQNRKNQIFIYFFSKSKKSQNIFVFKIEKKKHFFSKLSFVLQLWRESAALLRFFMIFDSFWTFLLEFLTDYIVVSYLNVTRQVIFEYLDELIWYIYISVRYFSSNQTIQNRIIYMSVWMSTHLNYLQMWRITSITFTRVFKTSCYVRY